MTDLEKDLARALYRACEFHVETDFGGILAYEFQDNTCTMEVSHEVIAAVIWAQKEYEGEY